MLHSAIPFLVDTEVLSSLMVDTEVSSPTLQYYRRGSKGPCPTESRLTGGVGRD